MAYSFLEHRIPGGIGADDRFWASLEDGEFRLPRCADCKRWMWPGFRYRFPFAVTNEAFAQFAHFVPSALRLRFAERSREIHTCPPKPSQAGCSTLSKAMSCQ